MTQQMFELSSLLLLICLGYFPWVIILCWTGYHMPSVLWPESAWSFFPYGCLEPRWWAVRLFRCLGPWGLHRIPSLGGAWDLRLAWISLESSLNRYWDLRLLRASIFVNLLVFVVAVAQRKRVMIILIHCSARALWRLKGRYWITHLWFKEVRTK